MFMSSTSRQCPKASRVHWLAVLASWLFLPLAAHAAPVSSVQISVPHRPNAGQVQLSVVRITLQLTNSDPIQLAITSPMGGAPQASQRMILTNAADDCFAGPQCFFDFPVSGGGTPDSLLVVKPQHLTADPASTDNDKLVLELTFNRVNQSANCEGGITANESWTIAVINTDTPADVLNRITGVAVQSLDKDLVPSCDVLLRPVPLNDVPFAQAGGGAPVISGRVGVDAFLVLDRSGSMSSQANPSDPTSPTKMTRLHSAAGSFLEMWNTLRTNETGLGIVSPDDKAGVVYFDDQINWLSEVSPSALNGLQLFSSLNLAAEKGHIDSVDARGMTSIGGGLLKAATALPSPAGEPKRKVILLMSDGMQNTNPLAQVSGSQVQTSDGVVSSLPNQPPIKIYSVTVGTGTAVDPTINQAVATASGGFYLNTEVDDSVLNNFFVQVLQNMHKYSTVETQRIVADTTTPTAPFTMQFPVTSTTTSLALSLNWSVPNARLSVHFTSPGGATFEMSPTGAAGTLAGGVTFPLEGGEQGGGLWTLRVIANGERVSKIPFNLMLLADDVALNSGLGIVAGEHAVGGKLRLTAQVNDLGKPIVGLNTQANARIEAFVVRPGNSLGDVLSAAAVQPPAPGPTDAASEAQRKLDALLAENPDALERTQNSVTLVDDGSAASGDEHAGDGRYSALVPAEFEGHYQIVFFVEGDSKSGGRFVRQQIRTAHVRSLPDTTNTGVTTQVTTGDGGGVLTAILTPKNIKNQMMGPGYANYFWFMPVGGTPVKGVDNLNGTYTATIPFTGSPPKVSVHFLPEPVFRADDFVPTPDVLTSGNTVIEDVNKDNGKPWWLKWWWVILLLLILLIIWLVRRRP